MCLHALKGTLKLRSLRIPSLKSYRQVLFALTLTWHGDMGASSELEMYETLY